MAVAGLVVLLVVSVNVLAPVVLAGLKLAVTPVGSPDAVSATLPLKLPLGMTMILVAAVFPCGIDRLAFDVDIVKSLAPSFGEGRTS